jgi:hypothetical protein
MTLFGFGYDNVIGLYNTSEIKRKVSNKNLSKKFVILGSFLFQNCNIKLKIKEGLKKCN